MSVRECHGEHNTGQGKIHKVLSGTAHWTKNKLQGKEGLVFIGLDRLQSKEFV